MIKPALNIAGIRATQRARKWINQSSTNFCGALLARSGILSLTHALFPKARLSMIMLRKFTRLALRRPSRLARQLGLWVFVGVLGIEVIIFLPSAFRRKQEQLDVIAMTAKSNAATLALSSPNLQHFLTYLPQIKQNAALVGGVVYQPNGQVIHRFGETNGVTFPQVSQRAEILEHQSWRYAVPIQTQIQDVNYPLVLVYEGKLVREDLLAFATRILFLVLIISLSLTLFMIWIANQQLIRPILWLQADVQRSTQAIEQEQSFENFASRQYQAQDELQEVIQAFYQSHQQIVEAIAQLRQTQAQLVHTEKMSSLGQLGAGFAHEVNNPINFISANLRYMHEYSRNLLDLLAAYQTELPQPSSQLQQALVDIDVDFIRSDMPNLLNSMQSGVDRIQNLVLSFRNFVRLDEADHKQANLHEGLDSTLLLLQNALGATAKRPTITIEKIYHPIPEVLCYPGQLNQVFMYLLTNAIEAIDRASDLTQPKITIETISEQQQVQIRITDNGCGIPAAIRAKVFDPFFTTKDVGQGMGLGLTNSYKIIHEIHQGKLEIAATADHTTFVITLSQSPESLG
jgi:signal transduction histidine kinase